MICKCKFTVNTDDLSGEIQWAMVCSALDHSAGVSGKHRLMTLFVNVSFMSYGMVNKDLLLLLDVISRI